MTTFLTDLAPRVELALSLGHFVKKGYFGWIRNDRASFAYCLPEIQILQSPRAAESSRVEVECLDFHSERSWSESTIFVDNWPRRCWWFQVSKPHLFSKTNIKTKLEASSQKNKQIAGWSKSTAWNGPKCVLALKDPKHCDDKEYRKNAWNPPWKSFYQFLWFFPLLCTFFSRFFVPCFFLCFWWVPCGNCIEPATTVSGKRMRRRLGAKCNCCL